MGKRIDYDFLWHRYQRLSHINFQQCHRIDTPEGYERAQIRERTLMRAFLNDCKRYLNEDLKPKEL